MKSGQVAAIGFLFLSGCYDYDLSCSSQSAQSLVVKIAKDEWAKEQYTMNYYIAEESTVKLLNIRTNGKTELKTDCAADLAFHMVAKTNAVPGGDVTIPVTYTLQVTDDKKLYATVYGLK